MEWLVRSIVLILWTILFGLIFYGLNHSSFVRKEFDLFFEKARDSNVYSYTHAGMLSDIVRNDLLRVYVPNSFDNTVSVIDPKTYKVIAKFVTSKNPQHIAPAYDLKTLFVLNTLGNSITPIDPRTGRHGINIPVFDPYNLYFTPDGRFAIVVAEAGKRLDFRNPHTLKLIKSVPVRCDGVNHMDFTADGTYAVLSCEFSGQLVKLDVHNQKILSYLSLDSCGKAHSMPQDVRLSPDGKTFYVADMMLNGVFMIDVDKFRALGFIATGKGAHSIYPSRDGRFFYVGNRGCNSNTRCPRRGPGSISVIDPAIQKVVGNWPLPGGGSPDMGNITADGKELWLSGRYDREVYVFDTGTGKLIHRIPVGEGPHGLTVWPQPGRYSLGHTGNMR